MWSGIESNNSKKSLRKESNMKQLYRVTFIRQDTGNEDVVYCLADNMSVIEEAVMDIIKIELIIAFKELKGGKD